MYLLLMLGLLLPQQSDAEKQVHQQVTEFAKSFYTSFENGDSEKLFSMSMSHWYHDGQSIISTSDVLRSELRKFVEQRDTKNGKRVPEVKMVSSYGVMKARMTTKDRELLEQVVKDDDYLALVMLKPAVGVARKSDNVVLLVRIKDGKASAIGVKHTQ